MQGRGRFFAFLLAISLCAVLLALPAFAFPKPTKNIETVLCESKIVAKDGFEYLIRESKNYPIPSEEEVAHYNSVLQEWEQGVLESLRSSPYFDEIRAVNALDKPSLHIEFKSFFEAAQKVLGEKKHPPKELRQVEQVLAAQNKYFNWLVNGNIKLVLSIALRMHKSLNLELDDVIQEGVLGLRKAAEYFDSGHGNKFSSYAYNLVQWGIIGASGNQKRTVRIPRDALNDLNQYKRAVSAYRQKHGREPGDAQMALDLNVSLEKIQTLKDLAAWRQVSLDSPVGGKNGEADTKQNLSDRIADEDIDHTLVVIIQHEDRNKLNKALSTLTPKEQSIIRAYFGLDDGVEKPLSEVGKLFQVSGQRIQQIHKLAMLKLAAAMDVPGAQEQLDEYKQKQSERVKQVKLKLKQKQQALKNKP